MSMAPATALARQYVCGYGRGPECPAGHPGVPAAQPHGGGKARSAGQRSSPGRRPNLWSPPWHLGPRARYRRAVSLWLAALLGLVQGVTEFLPISSTAHLRIVPALLGQPDPGAAFSAVIQLGTLAAVIAYFAR